VYVKQKAIDISHHTVVHRLLVLIPEYRKMAYTKLEVFVNKGNDLDKLWELHTHNFEGTLSKIEVKLEEEQFLIS